MIEMSPARCPAVFFTLASTMPMVVSPVKLGSTDAGQSALSKSIA